MGRPWALFVALVTLALVVASFALAAAGPRDTLAGEVAGKTQPAGRYIVVLRDGSSPAKVASRNGVRPQQTYSTALRGFSARLPEQALQRLRADPNVVHVEPDSLAALDVQQLPSGINRVDTDLNFTANIDGVDDQLDVDIAIIDSGISLAHPDLRVAGGVSFLGPDCGGDDYADEIGHGTHVAGIAAAVDNSEGVVGVAPGARLWSVRVLDDTGNGYLSCLIAAVDWVTANAGVIDVANISLRFSPSTALCDAIATSAAAGVVYAVSAGNRGIDASSQSPANCADVLATSAITDFDGRPGGLGSGLIQFACGDAFDDVFACFSNRGPLVDIAAPGVSVYSTYPGGYASLSGTSMSAPHVTGAAALDIIENGKPIDAAGAAAARGRLIASGAPQAGPHGFSGDPDAYPEPLLHLRSNGAQDLAVTALDALPKVLQGDTVQIPVTVERLGTGSETLTVHLSAPAGSVLNTPQTVALDGDASATLSFDWDTTGAPLGPYSLTASVDVGSGELNTANNSLTANTKVTSAHEIELTELAALAQAAQGATVPVEVSVLNSGFSAETFDVSLTADGGSIVGSPQQLSLGVDETATLAFTWLAPDVPDTYTLVAAAGPVPGEGYPADNTRSVNITVRPPLPAVNASDDPAPGSCDSQHCTLREAITEANATYGPDTISFDIPAGQELTIRPLSALPEITDPVVIDGTTQPGYAGLPIVELDLSDSLPVTTDGLNISAGGSTVRGLVINGHSGAAIQLSGAGGNVVQGNFIGTDSSGTASAQDDYGGGVRIVGSSNNLIGGSGPGQGNLISGNPGAGVRIGSGATGNLVRGNYIGTTLGGDAALPNGDPSVHIKDSPANTIGGPGAGEGNLIVGTWTDVSIEGSAATGNTIQGNRIRVNANATAAFCCASTGIDVFMAPNNIIGGPQPGAGNIISGHYGAAIFVNWLGNATGTVIQGNYLGVSPSGASLIPAGRSDANGYGVIAEASNTTIGGSAPGAGNFVAYNSVGVWARYTGTGNIVGGNSIHSNRTLGIDLDDYGVSPNDPGDADSGSNNLQNFPVLSAAISDGATTWVAGTINSTPNTSFTLEFFSNPSCDSSGYGEGETFLGSTSLTTGPSGDATFEAAFPAGVPGAAITATATDPLGSTSEFSACVPADSAPPPSPNPAPVIPVDSDGDGVYDSAETSCGADPLDAASRPERVDLPGDDDGDALADEPLPPGSSAYDCDGDGFAGVTETHVYATALTTPDQDSCGTNLSPPTDPPSAVGWPLDLHPGNQLLSSVNRVTAQDLQSFLAPVRYLESDVSEVSGNVRWDLIPGPGMFGTDINAQDYQALIAGSTAGPPMLAGVRALDGPDCPWPP